MYWLSPFVLLFTASLAADTKGKGKGGKGQKDKSKPSAPEHEVGTMLLCVKVESTNLRSQNDKCFIKKRSLIPKISVVVLYLTVYPLWFLCYIHYFLSKGLVTPRQPVMWCVKGVLMFFLCCWKRIPFLQSSHARFKMFSI